MLTLLTGAGGSGKTLYTMEHIEKLRLETGRPVYYYHIPEVKLEHWIQMEDPKKWNSLPSGAIFVIDECHNYFPQRGPGQPPQHVEDFAELRHSGYNAFLITQDEMSLDSFIRKRANRHIHFERKFGMDQSKTWDGNRYFNPRDFRELERTVEGTYKFNKEVYTWYKSADQHTIPKRIPYTKIFFKVGLPAIGLVASVSYFLYNLTKDDPVPEQQTAFNQATQDPYAGLSAEDLEALEWAKQFRERLAGQPHSASIYDAVLQPQTLPKIKGCGEVRTSTSYRCWCNTQQGTVITTITLQECKHYLKFGWFDPTKPDQEEEEGGSGAGQGDAISVDNPNPLDAIMGGGGDQAGA